MNQKIILVETSSMLDKHISLMYSNKPKGVDTETTGLDPLTSDLRLLQISDDEYTLVIDVKKIGYKKVSESVRPILENKEVVCCYHNCKFDAKFIKHHLKIDVGRIFDSYLAGILTQCGIRMEKGFHGLEKTALRLCDIQLNKEEQRSDWSGELSNKQLMYAAKDAQALLPIREAYMEKLRKLKLFRVAQLEFDAVLPVAWLELCGFYLNFQQWGEVAEINRQNAIDMAEEICKELAPVIPQGTLFETASINLNSPQQVQKYFRAFGIPMPDSTKGPFLLPLVPRYPILGKLLEYKGFAKAASSFGQKWEEFINPVTGRIHASFNQIGAEDTGRFSCSDPNLQQIPKENLFRNCFQAEEGNTLISGDYSQIELRLLADISRDASAIAEFAAGKDFHTATAELINRSRNLAKNCNFAIPYGATEVRVAATANISVLEARELMRAYFMAFPNFQKWIKKQQRDVLVKEYARTVSGRMTRFIFDPDNFGQKSQAQRNAVNMPIQGSSADILKRALRLFYDNTKDYQHKIKLVNIVHDEINVEAPESCANEVSKILKDSMESAGLEYVKEVEIKVDIKTAKMWSKD